SASTAAPATTTCAGPSTTAAAKATTTLRRITSEVPIDAVDADFLRKRDLSAAKRPDNFSRYVGNCELDIGRRRFQIITDLRPRSRVLASEILRYSHRA